MASASPLPSLTAASPLDMLDLSTMQQVGETQEEDVTPLPTTEVNKVVNKMLAEEGGPSAKRPRTAEDFPGHNAKIAMKFPPRNPDWVSALHSDWRNFFDGSTSTHYPPLKAYTGQTIRIKYEADDHLFVHFIQNNTGKVSLKYLGGGRWMLDNTHELESQFGPDCPDHGAAFVMGMRVAWRLQDETSGNMTCMERIKNLTKIEHKTFKIFTPEVADEDKKAFPSVTISLLAGTALPKNLVDGINEGYSFFHEVLNRLVTPAQPLSPIPEEEEDGEEGIPPLSTPSSLLRASILGGYGDGLLTAEEAGPIGEYFSRFRGLDLGPLLAWVEAGGDTVLLPSLIDGSFRENRDLVKPSWKDEETKVLFAKVFVLPNDILPSTPLPALVPREITGIEGISAKLAILDHLLQAGFGDVAQAVSHVSAGHGTDKDKAAIEGWWAAEVSGEGGGTPPAKAPLGDHEGEEMVRDEDL